MFSKNREGCELKAGDKRYNLLLTLGALVEIEDGLNVDGLAQLSARLRRLRAADIAIIAAALIRGGGGGVSAADMLRLPCSVMALADAVAAALHGEPGAAAETGVSLSRENMNRLRQRFPDRGAA